MAASYKTWRVRLSAVNNVDAFKVGYAKSLLHSYGATRFEYCTEVVRVPYYWLIQVSVQFSELR
jgi:hypothetical protein